MRRKEHLEAVDDPAAIDNRGFTLFETSIGACGVAWGARGLIEIALPDAEPGRLHARMARHVAGGRAWSGPLPAAIERLVADVHRLLAGEDVRFEDVELDLHAVSPFYRRVYDVTFAIPPGETLTYGDIASRISSPGSARAVGQALGRNPFPIVIPCHRVLAAGGKLGGFSAPGGALTKRQMLAIESVLSKPELSLFD